MQTNNIRHWLYQSRYYCKTHGIALPTDLAAAIKVDISSLSADYSSTLMEALHNYADGSMGMVEARNDFIQGMAENFAEAFDAGYADGGGDPDNMVVAASSWLGDREDQERQNILDLFRTLKDQMAIDPSVDIGSWISDRSGGYTGSMNDVYNMGVLFGKQGEALTFDGDDGKESCSTCQRLKGETHPASWWIENNLVPTQGNENFECGGWNCQHGLVDMDGNWVTLNPANYKMTSIKAKKEDAGALAILDTFPTYLEKDLPPQLQEDPNSDITMQHAAIVLTNHNPVEFEFAYGTDIVTGAPMIAEQYDGPWVRDNIWQDVTAGINAERYTWWKQDHYGVDSTTTGVEVLETLLHETVEALTMRLRKMNYGGAHSLHANPIEFEVRHGVDPKPFLRELGWDIQ